MSDARFLPFRAWMFFSASLAASALVSGCAVVTVASTVVSAGTTAVGLGVSATTTVAKGAVKATKAVANAATDDTGD